ncbi:GGDEF domain-containing protein [Arcobacter sp. FWKO B]|uniref:GGDEF domain-containing protein n=1 Tax=Arcobacter sp. FWKO B TaxID=2593672 RepID=UPI0018A5581B|nr:GGDEF domain-containing protein [Arcobacter sp. FWKO B]QOG11566.1 GGDEF domain-containing protein [Arcobacter sp. FWKO B]
MKHDLLQLIKNSSSDNYSSQCIENIFSLYENVQYSHGIDSLIEIIYKWFNKNYNIKDFKSTFYNLEIDYNQVLFQKGNDFYLDNLTCKTFIIEVHYYKNLVIAINADNENDFAKIENDSIILSSMFFLLNPIIKDFIIQKELLQNSLKDHITGFYNRKYLDECLRNSQLANCNDKSTAFFMIEVDRFKSVIDEFDYEIGDKVLIELAKVIKSIIPPEATCIKLTGYEMLVLINNINEQRAYEIAKDIISKFANSEVLVNFYTGQTLKKTACVGISIYPEHSSSKVQVIKYADIALQEAKNIGRSTPLVYKKEIESSITLF